MAKKKPLVEAVGVPVIESKPPNLLTKEAIESRINDLREKFKKETVDLEDYVKHCNTSIEEKKLELRAMQAEYKCLGDLLANFTW